MRRVAVVTPWFGAGLRGGAERQARELSLRLAARGHSVEVLTTCARSPHDDWSLNHYAAGVASEDGLTVRRFRVDPRDARAFERANAALLAVADSDLKPGVCPVSEGAARDFVEQNINSSTLVEFLRAEGCGFDAVVLLPYLYGTTLCGVAATHARALLQPCLHAEPYAHLPAVAESFRRARRVLFNSEGERALALRLYGPGLHARARIVGEGVEFARRSVESPSSTDEATTSSSTDEAATGEVTTDEATANEATTGDSTNRPAARPSHDSTADDALPAELRGASFVLYLGRRDATKNVDLLARAFRRFRRDSPSSHLALALAGDGRESFDARGVGLFDLGVVSEGAKDALLRAARALFQPSRRESFSRVLMESWLVARPVVVNRECAPTAAAVELSRGGWLAASEEEWAQAFAFIDRASDEELNEAGARGRGHAREQADWDRVVARYEEVFDELDDSRSESTQRGRITRERAPRAGLRDVHQLLPDAVEGDAITNHALSIRAWLRRAGYESRIYAKRREESLAGEIELFDGSSLAPAAGLVYHHSIGSDVTAAAVTHAGPKSLVYHNITPAEFYAPYRPGFAWLLERGRDALGRLARHFPCSAGVSAFNAAELAARGFASPGVLPIIVDPERWNVGTDERLMDELQDGATNLLFVGRSAPNKRQDALVEIFAEYVKLDHGARLVLAGEGRDSDPYFRRVAALVERLGLARRVRVTGRVSDAALLAYYRTAHLYLSASEHEGFGVPLVESMWFDVPVLARRGAGVAATLDGAGALYDPEATPAEIARLAHRLTRTDEEWRRRVVEAQRARREAFTPDAVGPFVEQLVRRMEQASTPRAEVA